MNNLSLEATLGENFCFFDNLTPTEKFHIGLEKKMMIHIDKYHNFPTFSNIYIFVIFW